MPALDAALSRLFTALRSNRTRRRPPRRLGDSVETLESRLLLSAVTATADTQAAEVEICSAVEVCSPVDPQLEVLQPVELDSGQEVNGNTDASGNEVHSLPLPELAGGETGDYDGTGAVTDLSQTFFLNSNPGASHTIYLDFDGDTTSGTSWNAVYNGGNNINTPAYSTDGSSTFSDDELARIQRIWQRVAEDFLPFDVNVTTQDPGQDGLTNSGGGDAEWGVRVVIGGDGSWYGSAGGVAYVGSFNWSNDTPTFVFEDNLGNGNEKYTAEAISHEAGHTLGLSHDGGPGTSYYRGHGDGETGWGPIMGVGYYENLTQWSSGEYLGATNTQDDLSIITSQNGFGYRVDDYGNTAGAAEGFVVVSNTVNMTGIVERNTDVDVFSFTTGAGTVDFTATPSARGPNLDILLELYDSSGNLVASANPVDELNATLNVAVATGTYYLHVSGVGKGDPLATGYTDYGSLGFYAVSGTIVDSGPDTTGPRVTGASSSGATAGTLDKFTLTFSEPIADGTFTLADVSLNGPGGAITPTAVNKISDTEYEVTFASQSSAGTYTLTVGPQIMDSAGNTMDQDQDGNLGEATQDQYTTTASIADTTGPRVISSTSSGASAATLDTFTLTFSEPIQDGKFTLADVSLTGPGGAITPAAVNKISDTQYEVTFASQSQVGTYTLTVGPQITDTSGNAMDQDQDGNLGEPTQDQYTTTASIDDTTGPRVTSSTASGATAGTLDRFALTFSEPIADGTFTLADVSLTGPGGAITPAAVNKISDAQYEVTFASQSAVGTYTLTVGPQITDAAGNAMDQDQDGNAGESTQDQYSTSATLVAIDPGLRFDFGNVDSPVSSGYQQVTGDMIYDSAAGYGWYRRGLQTQDQGSASDLTRDFAYNWYSRFAADLENGTYNVTVTLGDALNARERMGVNIEGVWLDTNISTAANEFKSLTYQVEVTDGQLLLLLRDFGGDTTQFAVNALQITAVGAEDTTGPQIVSSVGDGASAGTLDKFTLTFSEAIADGTFTLADVSLSGPGGTITPNAVNKLSSTQYEVTFAAQSAVGAYLLTVGPQITDVAGNAMDQDQDGNTGEATQDQYTTTANIADTSGPRVISSTSSGAAAGTLDRFTLTFSEAITDGTFTTEDISLVGPGGAIAPIGVIKLSSTQYEVTFAAQSAVGTYTLTVGPQITDTTGNAMDQDQDGNTGETVQDQYTTTANIADTSGPRVSSSTSSGATPGTLDKFTLTFNEPIADGTFTLVDVLLTGPGGAITPTAVNKISSTQYEVTFAAQSAVGAYTLTVGPQVLDLSGTSMDQDQDGTPGEATDDQFTVSENVTDATGPRIISSSTSGAAAGTLDKFTLTFSEPIADGSFTLTDVSLTGPGGLITPTAVNKLSSSQYEVTFAAQSAAGTYTLTVGPRITDLAGNEMDQDQDGTTGEATADQFTTSSTLQPTGSEWHFDFGTTSTPVASGYDQVHDRTVYNSSLGYGWIQGSVRDRDGTGSDLTRDYNYSKDATFAVDLANGTYDVTVTMGDFRRARDNMGVFLEGAQVDTVSTTSGQFATRTYTVQVVDGQLTLRLRDLGGSDRYAVINALDIVAV